MSKIGLTATKQTQINNNNKLTLRYNAIYSTEKIYFVSI